MDHISAVIITHNAAETISKCLDALNQVADEVIVVDSLSTDDTVALCKAKGATVFSQQWLGFGPQKNFGISKTKYNYILSIDADEILDAVLIQSILTEKKHGLKNIYALLFKHFYYTTFIMHGAEGVGYKKRLFDKRIIKWDDKEVHESLILPPGSLITELKGFIEHYSYKSIAYHVTKANSYTTQSAIELHKKGKTNYLFKMIFSPPVNFFVNYFLRGGFLDGVNGLIVAVFNSHAGFLKNAKLWEIIKNEERKK
jgi:glycosyltransferase involved in cell wall biosynthesis